ncbi:Uncharacterized conserved protein, DUF58 family, contains vWF domain [Geodermatophilus obscurus]|uniref:Uncharacterized conserved protein, DUF58 family, contains vWF domain n=1 Tax=Geodermatophilus obscurus TaxID=1861 RepID=A0A1I5FY69_9ACTN|nr:DUF58 domain-containing protein [Geodermatophilus obscurus]SFO28579.1 Uncharacterized conserved protein, DUF58 family, contains vWF domain [Geodermatophilus obscurus]
MAGQLRTALTSLTLRGRCLVAAGLTLLALGALLGERPLAQIAVFLLALPLLSALTVARQRFRVGVRRTVTPTRVPRGDSADVLLEVTNADRRTGRLWLLSEQLPAELGSSPDFVVERLAGGRAAALPYRVHGGRRGRFRLGPLQLRLVDPFGLVQRTTSGADGAPLLVVPRVRPLGPGGPAGGHGGGGEGARRSIAVHGEDDVSTRAYRHGDDLRKVHWRATARTGELMMRMEERPWRAQAALLLDTRVRAHLLTRASGPGPAVVPVAGPPGDPAPPPDSLEWLVEAAASIGTTLTRRGATLRVVTAEGELRPVEGSGGLGPTELLDRLAVLAPTRGSSLRHAVEQLQRVAGDGPVVAVLGSVAPDDLADLVAARSGPHTDAAVLLDVSSWADPGGGRTRRALSATARAALTDQVEQSASLLRGAGWQVAVAGAGRGVEAVWADLVAQRGAGLRPGGPLVVPA